MLDDVGLDGDAEVICLTCEIGGEVIVLVLFEGRIAQVAPENGGHPKFVSFREGAADFHDLTVGLIGAEVNGGADSGCAHVPSLFYRAEKDLVELVGERKQLVVIDFYDEGDFVCVFAGNGAQHA